MPQALTVSELTAMKDQLKNLTNMTYSDARNIITNTYLQINNKGYGYAALAADVHQTEEKFWTRPVLTQLLCGGGLP